MQDAQPGDAFQLSENEERHRFELRVAGELAAYSEYNVLKNGLLFTHTEVLPAFEGRGIGSAIAHYALGEVRRRSVQVIPVCQFMAGVLRKHPEYHDLLSPESRRAYRI